MTDESACSLAGNVGILTGGGSGIGAAIMRELAAHGAHVVASDLVTGAGAPAPTVAPAASEVAILPGDVRRFEDMVKLHDRAIETHGRLDFVVANAGIGDWGSMAEGDPERWRAVVETNLLGTAHVVRAALPTLRAQRRGHIVIMASASGRVTYVGEPIYIATKWALVGLARALRKEVASHRVRVSLIEPGLVDTALTRSTAEGRDELSAMEPLRAEDVARAVRFVLTQPSRVDVDELLLAPLEQLL